MAIYKSPLQRAHENPDSRKAAITAMCYQCMGGDEPGSKKAVRECTGYIPIPPHNYHTCPLWTVRPWK